MHKREINTASSMWPLFTVSEEVNSSLQCIFCQGREPIYLFTLKTDKGLCIPKNLCETLQQNYSTEVVCVSGA